ncbi:MAG: type II toxin-antitoxin system RelE/ParE family toxin [Alphaproteobacteria bacterium]|jgi:proteic killer suppression protein|nr:type II toxin-antitoxin system RelE/ParE family toxin [Alphaproteobacteria bacterium]
MIGSFKCKETARIWGGQESRKFPADIQERALVKLRLLDAALKLEDLAVPPSNRLKALKGERKGQMSLRVNDQWRICFVWKNGEARDVEIVDYH